MTTLKLLAVLALTSIVHVHSNPIFEKRVLSTYSNEQCSEDSFTVASGDNNIWPYREYKTSNATSPVFKIDQNGKKLSEGLIFLTLANGGLFGYPGVKQERALIVSAQGDLIWAGPERVTSNFRVQTLNNNSIISFWEGAGNAASNGGAAHGYGSVNILDHNYNIMHNVCPKVDITFPPGQSYDCVSDVHESNITPNNTMLVTVYNITKADLTSVGGPADGWVYDPLAVEVDIETSDVLWMWSPLEHVPVNSSRQPLQSAGLNQSNPYDWFHMNSISPHRGNILINSRNTWSSYYVDRSGSILWEINGDTGGDFGSLPAGANFSWEHHVQIYDHADSQLLLTLFADNNGVPIPQNASVGLGLILNVPPNPSNPPTIYTHLVDPKDLEYAFAEGSYDSLPNGNYFIGYGAKPVLKEFGNDEPDGGDVRWSAQFAYDNLNNTASSYRAFKQEWHGTPTTKPVLVIGEAVGNDSLYACSNGSSKRGYVSWNGATDVQQWAIYAATSAKSLEKVGEVKNRGFETEFVVPKDATSVQVAAVELGHEVQRSNIATTK